MTAVMSLSEFVISETRVGYKFEEEDEKYTLGT